ncbi:TRAP transporter substrate-binding protein DctP [Flavobacterium sp. AC]|uniref:TRAP transporter substrate-binding protein DctP n=1 Tax=Flavobacterium azizsancarii TaxID=2961580 RepID=A0ABT4W8I1_9FLAO|nr:TRAP transporter substrate-binding protein DctP [Flavobacterium azizsancarii]MDA6068871.1 TRAP transporter substrate-binding protein DctP [Flavobacterium azizsancarii]
MGKGVYGALKEGTLDGLMVNIDSGHDINAHEVAPNVVASKELWLGHVYLLVMNKDTWNSLAKEDQQAIQRAAESAYKTLGAVMDKIFTAMIKSMKNDGVNIRILKSKEVKEWQDMTRYKEVQRNWAKEQESKNIKDASTIVEKVSVILNDFTK